MQRRREVQFFVFRKMRPCCLWCANGANIAALLFSDHAAKNSGELLALKFDRFQTWRTRSQKHTTFNRMCKRAQHVTFNNAERCWQTMLRPYARG